MRAIRTEIFVGDLWADVLVQPDPTNPDRGIVVCLDADNDHATWAGRKLGVLRREGSRWRGFFAHQHRPVESETRALTTAQKALEELVVLDYAGPWESGTAGRDQTIVADVLARADSRDQATGYLVVREAAA
jgi:hypothetical protein